MTLPEILKRMNYSIGELFGRNENSHLVVASNEQDLYLRRGMASANRSNAIGCLTVSYAPTDKLSAITN